MDTVKTLKDILPTDPVNVLARLVPGAALIVGAASSWDAFAERIPENWESRPLVLIGFAIAAWVLGMFLGYLSHVLNRPYNWLVDKRRKKVGDTKYEQVKSIAGAKVGKPDDMYAFTEMAVATSASPELLGATHQLQAISKLFRTLCMASLIWLVWAIATAAPWLVIAGAAGFAALSWQIFFDHRWAATQAVYQGYLALKEKT